LAQCLLLINERLVLQGVSTGLGKDAIKDIALVLQGFLSVRLGKTKAMEGVFQMAMMSLNSNSNIKCPGGVTQML